MLSFPPLDCLPTLSWSRVACRCGLIILCALWSAMWLPSVAAQQAPAELLVLMHEGGTIERYDPATGAHLGTLLTGLPPSNALLADAEGRILISTGLPGGPGSVLLFDPRGHGSVETLLEVPEGYGGQLFRATGMAWKNGDLLVASQGDGRIKRYAWPSGEWQDDLVLATPGGITQIAVFQDRVYLTDFAAAAVRRAPWTLDGSMADSWLSWQGQAPWGLVLANDGSVFWSTSANRVLRSRGNVTEEWAGTGGELGTPIGLQLGPDGLLYVASLSGNVTVWDTSETRPAAPLRILQGPEMRQPISLLFLAHQRTEPFAWKPAARLAATPEKLAFFETEIRPLLQDRCVECHGPDVQEAELRLDVLEAWQAGGTTGAAIVPGKPDDSLLMTAVRYLDKDLQMPPDQPLSAAEIEKLRDWIADGAVDPRRGTVAPRGPRVDGWEAEFRQRLDWWSLRPPVEVSPPDADDPRWNASIVDRWVYAGLRKSGLQPGPLASPDVLVRRISFALTGLPPGVELQHEFHRRWQEQPQTALAWLVDELLRSSHFGEHFARHWMDCVRYTDTYGYEWDNPAKGSWEYRDYLIRAFNDDVPWDVLVREQLAGDLLPEPRIHPEQRTLENLIGPMFYHLGEHRHGSSLAFNGIHQEMMNNKIDAFSRAFLATTVACARCHDHKLEPVSQRDYYALGAIFMTPRWASRPIDAPEKLAETIAQLKQLRSEIRQQLARQWTQQPITLEALTGAVRDLSTPPAIDDVAWPIAGVLSAADVPEAWRQLERQWREANDVRAAALQNFQSLGELSHARLPDGWVLEGAGFEHGAVAEATPQIALSGETVLARLLPAGLHSQALSPRLPGVLRVPPLHQLPGRHVSVRLAGEEFSGALILDENAFQNESVTFLNQAEPTWRTFTDPELKNGVTRVTVDLATASLNPNFPPRTGVAPGLPNNDLGENRLSWLSVCGIATHDAGGVPPESLEQYRGLFSQELPGDAEQARSKLLTWLNEAVQRWAQDQSQDGDRAVLQWLLQRGLLKNSSEGQPELAALVKRYRELEQSIPRARSVNSMDERALARHGAFLNIRGNVDAPGDFVAPDFLSMFAGQHAVASSAGSGRLELVESLLSPSHPLTARVYVNRVWQWIFGVGLVASPDDFGRLGDRPSHPELLDSLAVQFVRDGWSTKDLVRQLILSQTFLQSGSPSVEALERDPANRLLHHYATRRLMAESVRDAMLLVSGRLDARLYGPPINPFRSVEDGSKRLFSGPLDGGGRRSMYLTMSIMAPPAMLRTFDLPDLKLPTGRRNETHVPAQSLFMLNDPLVHLLAEHWGQALCRQQDLSVDERLEQMFLLALSRRPEPGELQSWAALAKDLAGTTDVQNNAEVWTGLAHTLFNTAEFLHYR